MTCDQALEAVSARLDGALTQRENEELEAHLASCPSCRALARELAQLSLEAGQAWEEPPEGFRDQVMDRVAEEPRRAAPRRGLWRRWAGLAAVVALAAAVTLPRLPALTDEGAGVAPAALEQGAEQHQTLEGDAPGLSPFAARSQDEPHVDASLVPAEEAAWYAVVTVTEDPLPHCLAELDWQEGAAEVPAADLDGLLAALDGEGAAYTVAQGEPEGSQVQLRWQPVK